jgi:hypothetical protein
LAVRNGLSRKYQRSNECAQTDVSSLKTMRAFLDTAQAHYLNDAKTPINPRTRRWIDWALKRQKIDVEQWAWGGEKDPAWPLARYMSYHFDFFSRKDRIDSPQPFAQALKIAVSELTPEANEKLASARTGKESEYKMLFHDWSADPLVFEDSNFQKKIEAAQFQAIRELNGDDSVNEVVARFLVRSGIYERFSKSIGE